MYCFVINKSCISIRENKKKRFFRFFFIFAFTQEKMSGQNFFKKEDFFHEFSKNENED